MAHSSGLHSVLYVKIDNNPMEPIPSGKSQIFYPQPFVESFVYFKIYKTHELSTDQNIFFHLSHPVLLFNIFNCQIFQSILPIFSGLFRPTSQ